MSTNVRMAVIDGTGDWSDTSYAKGMHDSFCSQIARQLPGDSYYQRGPSNDGLSVRSKAVSAAEWLKSRQNLPVRLMLAGYSRGASAAIYAAEFLEAEGVPVAGLFLFDAVARHIYAGGEVIPANVAYSRHARRSQDSAFVAKYEGSIGRGQNPCRPSFGNTGTTFKGGGDHEFTIVKGSHGALGGVGWKIVSEDADAQERTAGWMNGWFNAKNVPVALRSYAPVA